MDVRFYDYYAREQDVRLEDITSCENNVAVLQWLRDGCRNLVWATPWTDMLCIISSYEPGQNDDEVAQFIVGEGDDLGWLGYFIGKCQQLRSLEIASFPEEAETEHINQLIQGISCNRSIQRLIIDDENMGQFLDEMGIFFRDNSKLEDLDFGGFDIGHESACNLALALGRSQHKYDDISLDTNLSDESVAEIVNSLTAQSQLKRLCFSNNNLSRHACVALENTFTRWHAPSLKELDLDHNAIDDKGLLSLVSGLKNCHNLSWLNLMGNPLSAAGMRSLGELFQTCPLRELMLQGANIGDDGVIALADALKGNKSLKHLRFNPVMAGITDVGWKAFSDLLCDTHDVNSTYLSNHTLETVGLYGYDAPHCVAQYLATNSYCQEDTALYKMLRCHPDFDMHPFFQWSLMFLPVVIEWFEKAGKSRFGSNETYLHLLENRKLSAVYQFIREFHVLVRRGYQA